MSEQEQDLVLGRFLREHVDAKRKLVLMRFELDSFAKSLVALGNYLLLNADCEGHMADEVPSVGIKLDNLKEALKEYAELRKCVTAGAERLREFGVDSILGGAAKSRDNGSQG